MEKIYDEKTMTWSYPDGSGLITKEQVIARDLFDTKWRMLNEMGKPDVDAMIEEHKSL